MMSYKESDLVLQVSKNVNPQVWDEGKYSTFFDILFKNRQYQLEATETVLRYLNSEEYSCLEDLLKENFDKNEVIQERFNGNINSLIADVGLPNKLSATVDLATGTGKSFVMYAIAVCMLAEKKVDRVLVLVPSITIEKELTDKFKQLAENDKLNAALGSDFVPPAITNGDQTIVENSIAIENRDAIYKSQENRNSIVDSISEKGERTLLLNDEVHHVFYSEGNQWKEFIEDKADRGIAFKYVIGLTGTAYKKRNQSGEANEYLSDVIYRYSLKEAIEQGFIKDIEYIDKADMPSDAGERWQVIVDSHEKISSDLNKVTDIKPITIIVTGEKRRADAQAKKFKKFLQEKRGLSKEQIDNIVIFVHSGDSAAADRLKLRDVDNQDNPVEFIFSVSMLTEGWDVKRVFQIVPDEERAFNSKLLIAQVLGRGLRRPEGWQSEWGVPKVIVFNHEKWAPRVKNLVNELLDFKKVIFTSVDPNSEYNFELLNVNYTPEEISKKRAEQPAPIAFLENGFVKLPTDSESGSIEVQLLDIQTNRSRTRALNYSSETFSVKSVAQAMYDRFSDLPSDEKKDHYESLWPISELEKMINLSLQKSSNTVITRKIRNAFLNSMNVLFRDYTNSVSYESKPSKFKSLSTKELSGSSTELYSLTKNKVLFYTDKFNSSNLDDASKVSLEEVEDTTKGYNHMKVSNSYLFKTPQRALFTTGDPETNFVKRLIKDNVSKVIDSFIKSTDTNFYHFDYTWKKGTHQQYGSFNPDFFIKKGDQIIVVEIKDDMQIINPELENVGKYKAAQRHFDIINKHLADAGEDTIYKFTFLTPKNYQVFFSNLEDADPSKIMNFNSELDVKLSEIIS